MSNSVADILTFTKEEQNIIYKLASDYQYRQFAYNGEYNKVENYFEAAIIQLTKEGKLNGVERT